MVALEVEFVKTFTNVLSFQAQLEQGLEHTHVGMVCSKMPMENNEMTETLLHSTAEAQLARLRMGGIDQALQLAPHRYETQYEGITIESLGKLEMMEIIQTVKAAKLIAVEN
jgi:hypothetical protein